MLLMKKHLITLIKAGTKRQTIRLWATPRVRVGQDAFVPGLGRVRILAVDRLASLAALTHADARADGFASRRQLLAALRAIYGAANHAGKTLFRIRFAWPTTRAAATAVPRSGRRACTRIRPSQGKPARPRRGKRAARELLRRYVLARAPAPPAAKRLPA